MPGRDIVTNISVRDGASGPLKKIATAAGQLGDAMEQAGADGVKGLGQVDTAATKAEASVKEIGTAAGSAEGALAGLGAAATVLGAGLTVAGDAAMRQQQQIIGIQRAFGEAGDEMLSFAEAMDAVTMFSDDDIRGGERYFATLRTNYDLSIAQIQQLMQATADLASVSGVSFEDASSRVTAAIRGEGEAAEYLGLTMNQQSIDRQNLTLSMTNQEAAQFRLNALLEQSAVYQGSAAEMASSSAGIYADLQDKLMDVGQALAGVNPLLAKLGGMGLAAGGIGQLFGAFKTIVPVLSTMKTGLIGLVTAAGPVGLALTGLAAAGGIVYKIIGDHRAANQRAAQSYENLQLAIENTDDAMLHFQLTEQGLFSSDVTSRADTYRKTFQDLTDGYQGLLGDLQAIPDGENPGQALVDWIHDGAGKAVVEWAADGGIISDDVLDAMMNAPADRMFQSAGDIRKATEAYVAAFTPSEGDKAAVEEAFRDLINNTLAMPGIDGDAALAKWDELWRKFVEAPADGTPDIQGFISAWETWEGQAKKDAAAATELQANLNGLTAEARAFNDQMNDLRLDGQGALADQLTTLNDQFLDFPDASSTYTDAVDRLMGLAADGSVSIDKLTVYLQALRLELAEGTITNQQFMEAVIAGNDGVTMFAATLDDAAGSLGAMTRAAIPSAATVQTMASEAAAADGRLGELSAGLGEVTAGLIPMATAAVETAAAWQGLGTMTGAAGEAMVETYRRVEELAGGLLDLGGALGIWSVGLPANDVTAFANAVTIANDAMSRAQGTVITQTDGWARQSQGLADWATELINVSGQYGRIDDLVKSGAISQEQYNAAQAAYYDIMDANTGIQEDVLAIQAQQAPVLADLSERQAAYVESIRAMNDGTEEGARKQLAALGMMDSAVQGQVTSILEMSGSYGEMSDQQQAMFENMIAGAAAADPVLASILEQYGLISVGADGTITVNTEGLEGAQSETEQLTLAIVALADLLDDGQLNGSVNLEVVGIEKVDDAKTEVESLPDEKTVTVDAEAGPSLTPGGIGGLVADAMAGAVPPTVPVDGDTAPLEGSIAAIEPDPIVVPVETGPVRVAGTLGGVLGDIAGGLAVPAPTATATVQADTGEAMAALDDVADAYSAFTATATATVAGNGAAALGTLEAVSAAYSLVAPHATAIVDGDASGAFDALGLVSSSWAAYAPHATAFIDGDSSGAFNELNLVSQSWAAYAPHATAYIDGDSSGAFNELNLVSGAWAAYAPHATAYIDGDTSGAFGALGAVSNAWAGYAPVATASINAVDNASWTLWTVGATLSALDGRTATTYINTVYGTSTIGGNALGGVAGYGNGGVVIAELAEWGPERLRFANGGTAIVADRGLYAVPAGTYISPNNATGEVTAGGINVSVNVAGTVLTELDLAEISARHIAPALTAVLGERARSAGVRV